MGNWNISIQGIGCHGNSNPEIDADAAFREIVERLAKQGQLLEHANFTYGGCEHGFQHAIASAPSDQVPALS